MIMVLYCSGDGRPWQPEPIERCAMQNGGADQPAEAGDAVDRVAGPMRELDQHEGDQGDRDLKTHRVLADAVEVAQLEHLLDPTKEQLDIPFVMPLII